MIDITANRTQIRTKNNEDSAHMGVEGLKQRVMAPILREDEGRTGKVGAVEVVVKVLKRLPLTATLQITY